jgi:gas vesicle protein GvpN
VLPEEEAQMIEEFGTILEPRALHDFVDTKFVKALTERAMGYITAGFPVHFRGASGTGKTTLALHVASKIGRPVVLMHGDEEFTTSNLVGGENGYRLRKVIDRFVSRVLKVEEDMVKRWVDNRLTIACKYGFTLIYDEFTRSRPEANNILLSILQERILDCPLGRNGEETYLRVDPNFTAIFTSNPEEYAGVHKTQDALMDRLIVIKCHHYDRETEVRVTMARSGIPRPDADSIVDVVRELRRLGVNNHRPTIRACIAIARILAHRRGHACWADPLFRSVCHDVLNMETAKVTHDGRSLMREKVDDVIRRVTTRNEGLSELASRTQ